jgi:hypothetical protein
LPVLVQCLEKAKLLELPFASIAQGKNAEEENTKSERLKW